ncbi:MAG TPA: TPM domain-containing protein, partial [Pyrinomonadaceae bacterium]
MTPSYRVLKRLLAIIPAVGLFLLISVNPLAQSGKLPAPASHVSDFAGVLDAPTKSRLENLLQNLKDKSKIDLYVAMVDNTGPQEISVFSQQLARDWNIGAKTTRGKSLLLVVSTTSKTSFTQFSRTVQAELPDGVLGEMTYRMQGPLSDGRFVEAIDSGVHVFANALAEKIGFNVADLDTSAVAVNSPEVASDSPKPVLVSAKTASKTRRRTVADVPQSQSTPETPRTDPTPTETPNSEPSPSESPKTDPTPAESPKTEAPVVESPKNETSRRKASATTRVNTPVRKKTAAQIAEEDADESEEVELTLTLPLDKRAVKLKEWLDTHPNSKSRTRATELLISTHAGLGDQKLKNGDIAGGIEQLTLAIEEADVTISDQLFSGVIAQIPSNLYLRGEREAAYKAAQSVEAKFGIDPKRLLAVAGFYLGIEGGSETVRLAEKAVKLAPDLAEAHRILAVGLHISLRLDEAIAEYKRTLELDPTSKVSRGSLADLYRASGKFDDALALYNEQLVADPKDKAAQAGKVISLFELGRNDEANTALEAALADEPRNLPLLAGAAYWLTAHDNNEKAFDLARKATAIEPRYTWAQIALVRSLLGLKRPLDAERAMRYARQYGKFPTLTYELANVLSSMGLYDEAAEVLRESFTIKDGQIQTYLAGHLQASEPGFLELLAPERRAGIYQSTSADSAANAKTMKALLAFNAAITPATDGEKVNQADAVAAAKDFAAGTDSMRAFRQLYAASRLLRQGVGVSTALDLIAEARKASDEALKVPVLTMAVQADEFRDLRARAIASGNVPDVAEAPHNVLANILKGRIEELHGWALFNDEKYPEAITHLKQASEILPAETPAWRTAL